MDNQPITGFWICPQCGNKVSDQNTFCTKCGAQYQQPLNQVVPRRKLEFPRLTEGLVQLKIEGG